MTTLKTYFDIEYGQREYHSKRDLKENKNGTPLISAKAKNQGIYGYYDIEPKYSNVISVPNTGTGTICHALYQGKLCCIDDNCLVLIPKIKLALNEIFYFVLLIRKQRFRFMRGRQITDERLGNLEIPDKIPKWVYEKKVLNTEIFSQPLEKKIVSLKSRKWNFFRYDYLFDIQKGKRLVVSKNPTKGNCPYVSAVDKNNGISNYLDIEPNHKGNLITVNYDGSVGEAFYQANPFWASDSVNILYPLFELNPFIAMFLLAMIKKEKYRFNYSRKWNWERMIETSIFLPVDSNGKPDWEFMQTYVKTLQFSSNIQT
jgi:hypothetical protein